MKWVLIFKRKYLGNHFGHWVALLRVQSSLLVIIYEL